MEITGYDLWVDDHSIDDHGNVFTLAKFARPGVDPQVGQVLLVSDGEVAPRPARVVHRSSTGVVLVSFDQVGDQAAAQG